MFLINFNENIKARKLVRTLLELRLKFEMQDS